jgi:hypothetical protein
MNKPVTQPLSARFGAGVRGVLLCGLIQGGVAAAQEQPLPGADPKPGAAPAQPSGPPPVLEVIPVQGAAASPEPAAERDDDTVELEEVIVTSQKTKQSLREVPA